MDKQGLGNLQQLAMLAVMRLDEGAHAGAIRKEIQRTTGKDLTVSTVHVTLVRLEKRGLCRSSTAPADGTGGKPKRLFALTHEGRAALREERRAMDQMWDGLSPDLP